MRNIIENILIWGAITLALLSLGWFLISPIVNHYLFERTFHSEIIIYVRWAVFMLSVVAFAMLRLYNAIVGNTRFLIKLREAMLKVHKQINGLERELKNLSNSVKAGKKSTDDLTKTINNKEI